MKQSRVLAHGVGPRRSVLGNSSIHSLSVGKTAARPRSGSGFITGVVRRTAIVLASSIVNTLRAMSVEPVDEAGLGSQLRQLAGNIRRIIPGFSDAGLLVMHDGRTTALRTTNGESHTPYRSSLLVGSQPVPRGVQLLIRASSVGALATLGAELLALSGGSAAREPLVDLHLYGADLSDDADVGQGAQADTSAVNQAVGALLDRGWLPQEAVVELDRLASQLAVSRALAARMYLRGLLEIDRMDALKSS